MVVEEPEIHFRKKITLENELHVLEKEKYDELFSEVKHYFDKSLEFGVKNNFFIKE
ncbi:hypothetical protein ACFTQL_24595 [Peribacillus butanolivorans]|uniref:hypothetical protein n=1 Tax=Peribacillus butanolivorans TaxID=421767 RepID=UPI00363D6654